MAKKLLDEGHKYGRQYVVFENPQSYPAYVLTYTMPRTDVGAEQLRWQHKAAREETWTEYSAEHKTLLSEVYIFCSSPLTPIEFFPHPPPCRMYLCMPHVLVC